MQIAHTDIYTAAATNDVDAIRRNATLANVRGGLHHWEPLLYACYSRVAPTLDAARVLLDHRHNDPVEAINDDQTGLAGASKHKRKVGDRASGKETYRTEVCGEEDNGA